MIPIDEYAVYIDPVSRDFAFDENGGIKTVSGTESYAQGATILLRTFKGEFSLLPHHGTDYDQFLGLDERYVDDEVIKTVVRDALFQEHHIKQIDRLDLVYSADKNANQRVASVSFSATTLGGDTITQEVMI